MIMRKVMVVIAVLGLRGQDRRVDVLEVGHQ
jgi:hypothetical protein